METIAAVHGKRVSGAESAWYCLRAQPKREHIAAAHLRILQGVTVFCPRIRFQRATQRGLVWVTEAMFPGYLFAR
ncbi:MAG TPA: transcription termination/antitermination NusG family protein, partial [Chthoniobacterales bacterium]|nr:transcription termination/antitermination NusG family protein [Chthoniobacterales bacterium]